MRLNLANVSTLPPHVQRPGYDPAEVRTGIVHLGLGAFHRAHQAVYIDEAIAAGGGDWGISAFSQRSLRVPHQLQPQDGLYTVLERGADRRNCRVVGSIREVALAPESMPHLVGRIASADTHIVTLTVTEKGYRHDPATGRLRRDDPDVAGDATGRAPVTVVGQLVAGIAARRQAGGEPLTVLCCDNLPANGRLLQGLVGEFASMRDRVTGEDLHGWMRDHVTFPSTMVDRIVPATSQEDLATVAGILGVDDLGAVVAEPFSQWVIEDRFAADRPDFAAVGAALTGDVSPYERVKLRMLNGSHSTAAYLGALSGAELIAEVVSQPRMDTLLRRLLDDDVIPTLVPPPALDLAAYRDRILERFANPHIRHRTGQVAMDGSQKLPQRWLGTARDRLASGVTPRWICLSVAAWMAYVADTIRTCGPDRLEDPLSARLGEEVTRSTGADDLASRLLSLSEVFGHELPADSGFRDAVVTSLRCLRERGVADTVDKALATD